MLPDMAFVLDAALPFPEVDLQVISGSTTAREQTTCLGFFGISVSVVVVSVRERRVYVELVLVRLTGAETEVVASSSEFSSGTARFLPLASFVGSLIVSAVVAGKVERRALHKGRLSNGSFLRHRRVYAPLVGSRSSTLCGFFPLSLRCCRVAGSFRGRRT